MDEKRFPKYIALPLKIFILLEWDDFVVAGGFYCLAELYDNGWFYVGCPIGPFAYRKAKEKYGRGFLTHFFRWAGIKEFKGYPSTFEKRFLE